MLKLCSKIYMPVEEFPSYYIAFMHKKLLFKVRASQALLHGINSTMIDVRETIEAIHYPSAREARNEIEINVKLVILLSPYI